MAAYLFWELLILIIGVWLMATLFFIYGWLLLKRQKKMMTDFWAILETTKTLPPKELTQEEPEPEPIHLEISKNEPIGKYQNLSSERPVDISFVEEKEDE